jgi:DNA-directed RNA polymerase subunit RPC12/RpoP
MAAREHFEFTLSCEPCGTRGLVKLSEEDHPFARDMRRSVDGVEGEFEVTNEGPPLMVRCLRCGSQMEV